MNGRTRIRPRTNRQVRKVSKGSKRVIRAHAADLLAIAAGIGLFATGITSYTAGQDVLLQNDDGELSWQQKLRILSKPLLIGAGTLLCIGGSRHFGRIREKEAIAAATLLAEYINRQEKQANESIRGHEQSRSESDVEDSTNSDIEDSTNSDIEDGINSDIEDTGTGDIIFTEWFTGRRFKASMGTYEYATRKLQENFSVCGIATLNDLYGLLNLKETAAGEVLAWTVDQMILDPYYEPGDDFVYDEALTTLAIQLEEVKPNKEYIIHYNVLPIGSLAGIGPCNY